MKNRIFNLLDINNSFYAFAKKLIYVFILNILFIMTSIPIFTIGTSCTAMNSVYNKIINEKDFSVLGDYFKSFKINFIKSTIVWIIGLVLGFIIYVDIFYWVKYGIKEGTIGYLFLGISVLFATFYLMVMHAVFPLIERFDMSVKEYINTAIKISVKHLFLSIEAVISTILIFGITFLGFYTRDFFLTLYISLLCFGLTGLIQSYIYRTILNNYSEEYLEYIKKLREEEEEEY